MRNLTQGRTVALILAGISGLTVACNLPPLVDPVTPPAPKTVLTRAAAVGGSFECGGSMTCGPGTALVGERDGTSCGVTSQGLCSAVETVTDAGKLFSGVHHANCSPLPFFLCGQAARCPDNKVLVGYSDGTQCGVPNGGQCCDLVTDVGNRQVVPTTCSPSLIVACGERSQCASGQAMVGRQDSTGCSTVKLNQITCCNLAIK